MTKTELEEKYGEVYTTKEVQEKFTIHSFLAPSVAATNKETNKRGYLTFQDDPRVYFNFIPN